MTKENGFKKVQRELFGLCEVNDNVLSYHNFTLTYITDLESNFQVTEDGTVSFELKLDFDYLCDRFILLCVETAKEEFDEFFEVCIKTSEHYEKSYLYAKKEYEDFLEKIEKLRKTRDGSNVY